MFPKTLSFKSHEHWSYALYALEGSGRAALSAQLSPHRSDVFCEGLFLVLKLSPHMRCQPPASRAALHKSRRHVRPTDSGRAWLRRRPIDSLTSLAAARPPCACPAPPTQPTSHARDCFYYASYTLLFQSSRKSSPVTEKMLQVTWQAIETNSKNIKMDLILRLADVWKTCNKIRAATFRVGLNLWDWYRPLDPDGNCLLSESKFVSILAGPLRPVVGLSDSEISQLADYFRAQDGRVHYHQLCQIIHGEGEPHRAL
ncbi:hypothetical protein RR46_03912 [Papilio xuthus]|uniref:EF-hand domain-containing protein n=1 Tax=Papilio xuthus TaxID=66420 RepID=A0A194Q1U3_PAPXU|nr:hypothetical protein RR46_03912 [Papilio xuthus]